MSIIDGAEVTNLTEEVEAAFDGEFMQPQTLADKWHKIEDDQGTTFYPVSEVGDLSNVLGNHDDPDYVATIWGYGARLSAAGYMDCTDWTVFETEQEALEFLLETYAY